MSNELMMDVPPRAKLTNRIPQLLILGTILLAAFLRFYQLPALPPGLNFDEAGSGVAGLEILGGSLKIWWRLGGGQEPFWPYLVALSTALWGNIPLALRFPAVFSGILSVAAVYPLMLTLSRSGLGQNRRDHYLIAWLTILGLAGSDWHLHFSRLGFRAILLPLFSSLAFYFYLRFTTWVGQGIYDLRLRRQGKPTPNAPRLLSSVSWSAFAFGGGASLLLAAFFTALAIYSYLAARLLPLVPLLFGLLSWLAGRIRARSSENSSQSSVASSQKDVFITCTRKGIGDVPQVREHFIRQPESSPHFLLLTSYFLLLTSYFLLLLLVFLAPLILYFIFNPTDFVARAGAVSIFNPAWNKGDLIGAAWGTLITTLGTFVGLTGDPNPLVNLPGQSALPPVLAPFFLWGVAVSLFRSVRFFFPGPRSPVISPHLFLLCWWGVMLLPASLAPEGAPHHLRLLGAIVPTYALVALGLVAAGNFFSRFISFPLVVYLFPALLYLPIIWQTYTGYFIRWPAEVDFTLPFDRYAVRLAADMAHLPPRTAYVLPMDLRAGDEARHYTLDYLSGLNHPAYTYLPVDEQTVAVRLTQAAQGQDELRVVRWTEDKHHEADAKELVTYLLETTAQLKGRESFPVYEVETYTLPNPQTGFAWPLINRPVEAVFDNRLRLDAAFVPTTASPGHWLPVALTLTPLSSLPADYKASVRLISSAGERLAQKDRILLHNFHQGTSLWPLATVNEYYLLPVPPETPPGHYTVAIVIYQPDTQSPLLAKGLVEVPLGPVQVK